MSDITAAEYRMMEYRREELIALLERAVVPHEKWGDRDSAAAQRQAGEALFLLKAGCLFKLDPSPKMQSNERTIWIEIQFHGFAYFDWDGNEETETYYLPTPKRLAIRRGCWRRVVLDDCLPAIQLPTHLDLSNLCCHYQ